MPVPDFIARLRSMIGHEPLWLPGVSAVVFDDGGRILLGQRADTGRWSLISGIPEPGEEPAAAMVREIKEETGVEAVPERLCLVSAGPQVTYPNGDVCSYMNMTFVCRAVGGEAAVCDDESLAVGWFTLDDHPELDELSRVRLEHALADRPAAWFAAP